jgi:hypothetical protein
MKKGRILVGMVLLLFSFVSAQASLLHYDFELQAVSVLTFDPAGHAHGHVVLNPETEIATHLEMTFVPLDPSAEGSEFFWSGGPIAVERDDFFHMEIVGFIHMLGTSTDFLDFHLEIHLEEGLNPLEFLDEVRESQGFYRDASGEEFFLGGITFFNKRAVAVSEPSILAVLLLSLAGLALQRRFRRYL